jgi:hypothetical protein
MVEADDGYRGPKVMFFAANDRLRWDAGRARMLDGKVGMWRIARQIPAARSSRNRPAGTLEWKSHSLTKEVYTTLVFEKLVPVIVKNWPHANKRVLIQQDNASTPVEKESGASKQAWWWLGLEFGSLLSTSQQSRHKHK